MGHQYATTPGGVGTSNGRMLPQQTGGYNSSSSSSSSNARHYQSNRTEYEASVTGSRGITASDMSGSATAEANSEIDGQTGDSAMLGMVDSLQQSLIDSEEIDEEEEMSASDGAILMMMMEDSIADSTASSGNYGGSDATITAAQIER